MGPLFGLDLVVDLFVCLAPVDFGPVAFFRTGFDLADFDFFPLGARPSAGSDTILPS